MTANELIHSPTEICCPLRIVSFLSPESSTEASLNGHAVLMFRLDRGLPGNYPDDAAEFPAGQK
jgi:hypothetical protein